LSLPSGGFGSFTSGFGASGFGASAFGASAFGASGFGASGFGCRSFSAFVDCASEPLGPLGSDGAPEAISFEVRLSAAPFLTLFVTGCSDLVLLLFSGGCSPDFCGTE
jgi:hypothetical protein